MGGRKTKFLRVHLRRKGKAHLVLTVCIRKRGASQFRIKKGGNGIDRGRDALQNSTLEVPPKMRKCGSMKHQKKNGNVQ